MFFRKKKPGPPITVEVSIQGVIGERYLSVVAEVSLDQGSTVKHLINHLEREGQLDREGYRTVRGVNPPLQLLINGNQLTGRRREKTELMNGDTVLIFTPVSGG